MADGGYVKFYRSIESSEDFVGMRADQCWVAVRIVQLANYKPGFSRFRGQAIPVGRGELAHTLETIAARTNTTIKVARTTVARLIRTGFLGTRTGTVAGTPYRILIVRNYEAFQGPDDETGTVAGTAPGSDRARDGHETGTDRALRERREEGEEDNLPGFALDASNPPAVSEPKVRKLNVQQEAFEYWRDHVWPRISPATCPQPGPGDFVQLAKLCKHHGLAEVKAAMERAVSLLASDPFTRDSLALNVFVSAKVFPRYLPRGAIAPTTKLRTLTAD